MLLLVPLRDQNKNPPPPGQNTQGKIPRANYPGQNTSIELLQFSDIQYQVLIGFICKETYIYKHTQGKGGGDEDIESLSMKF